MKTRARRAPGRSANGNDGVREHQKRKRPGLGRSERERRAKAPESRTFSPQGTRPRRMFFTYSAIRCFIAALSPLRMGFSSPVMPLMPHRLAVNLNVRGPATKTPSSRGMGSVKLWQWRGQHTRQAVASITRGAAS
eukprot:98181-Prymnesium_polylepis.1